MSTSRAVQVACAAAFIGRGLQNTPAERRRMTRPYQPSPTFALPKRSSAAQAFSLFGSRRPSGPPIGPSIERTLQPTNFLVIGNPGAGKSTFLNGLVASLFDHSGYDSAVLFRSGVSICTGLTSDFEKKVVGRHSFMDTPGLADIDKRKQAAKAITTALRQGGFYKIILVITLESGRVRADDLTTVQLVLDAAPINSFGIIVNQVEPSLYSRLLAKERPEDQAMLNEICFHLTQHLKNRCGTQSTRVAIHARQRDPNLEGKDNAVIPLDKLTLEFIRDMPGMEIKPDLVHDIRGENFEEIRSMMRAELAKSVATTVIGLASLACLSFVAGPGGVVLALGLGLLAES